MCRCHGPLDGMLLPAFPFTATCITTEGDAAAHLAALGSAGDGDGDEHMVRSDEGGSPKDGDASNDEAPSGKTSIVALSASTNTLL